MAKYRPSYHVIVINGKIGDCPSLFQLVDFPTSHFKWREDLMSTFSPQEQASNFSVQEQVSSFGLKNMAEGMHGYRQKTHSRALVPSVREIILLNPFGRYFV